MIHDQARLLERIRSIHAAIRDEVVAECERSRVEQLSRIDADDEGDTIFAIDRVSERVLVEHFGRLAEEWPCVLVAEGLGATGRATLTPDGEPESAEIAIIVDPIDGTRGVMYQKRPAWILTGVAPYRGEATSLSHIEIAVQTEIPLVKQHLCDSVWAAAGEGARGERLNRLTGEREPFVPAPSRAATLEQGYGNIARFFPGARAEMASVDDEVVERIAGPVRPGKALAFEDQYICTGGQLYELMMGHDRWIADLRPLAEPALRSRGLSLGLCCHPYDLCTELVARQAGVVIEDEHGRPLDAPLDVSSDVSWIGYANDAIRDQISPVLRDVLRERGLIGGEGGLDVEV